MSKILPTTLSISWRVEYNENGEATGRHVAICANAEEAAPFGRRIGTNMMLSSAMLEQIKINEPMFEQWVECETNLIVKGFALKAAQEHLDMKPTDFIVPIRTQLTIGMKRFCEDGMPWHHIFYTINTIRPGDTLRKKDGSAFMNVIDPMFVIVKAD